MRSKISVTLVVKNAQNTLFECLKSLECFEEVIVLDNQSSDESMKIAQEFKNVKIYQSPFIGFGALKNLAISYASHDWILSLDSDEVLESELIEEIASLDLKKGEYYSFLRKNYYRGEWIKGCGWHPDWVKRIFNKHEISFENALVHEGLKIPKGFKEVRLKGAIRHYSFEDVAHLIEKMQRYSSLWAKQNAHRSTSVLDASLRSFWTFVRNYGLKRGFLYGYRGFLISVCNALGVFFKYMKLYEQKLSKPHVSLIVTTYNQKERLALVLDSILEQSMMPLEVLIADDGSGEESKEMIECYKKKYPIALVHVWQEDLGYRLARSRNRAIMQAKGEYVIIVDGDMILSPQFVEDHLSYAKRGCFNQGGRILLSPEQTQALMQGNKDKHLLRAKSFKNRRIPWLSKCIFWGFPLRKNAIRANTLLPVKGCNMAFYKEDALKINGFNQDFVGWGREDSEFVVRFLNAGGEMRRIKFLALAYHLNHEENPRNMLEENHKIYLESIEYKKTWCENGLEQSQ